MKALVHARLYDFCEYREDSYLLFDEKIVEVGPMARFPQGDHHIIDCQGQLVLPGFVCGHTHLYSAFSRGLKLPFHPHNFQEILDQLWWKLDRHLNHLRTYYSALSFGAELLKNGVTTLIDHHASKQEIRGSLTMIKRALVDKLGVRAVLAFETSDRFPLDDCLEENLEVCREVTSSQIAGLFGMHASMSLSDASLERIRDANREHPIHIHVAESIMDQEDSQRRYHKSVVKRLDDYGLIRPDSLLVHCVHVDDAELAIIKDRQAVIAVNVSSNQNNGVGLPDIKKMRDFHIPVIIGNDGFYPDMTREYGSLVTSMHHRYQSPIAFSLSDLNALIQETYRYASRRLHLTLGHFQTGAAADIQIVPYQAMTMLDSTNIMGHLVFGLFPQYSPQTVFVGGQVVVDHGIVRGLTATDIQNTQAVAQACWQEIEREGDIR